MAGQRITEDGNRRISESNLIRITEDFIRTWPLTATSVSLSTTATTTITAADVILVSGSSSLSTSATNTIILIDFDKDIVAVPAELVTSKTNTTLVIDIDTVVAATNGALNLSLTDTSIVIVKDVELTAIPGHLELDTLPPVTFVDKTLLERDSRLYSIYLLSAIDVTAVTIKAVPVTADYTFDATHEHLDDLGSNTIDPAVTLSGSKWYGLNGEFKYSPNKIKFLTVTGDVAAFVLYRDTGDAATSELISYHREDFKGLTKGLAAETLDWTLSTAGFFDKEPENVYVGRVTSYIDRIAKSNIRI